ncbi:MAG: nitrogenase component 1 [Tissierellia bacterium]|nr:nitrogenase component 1 [Tissierellia bacterium]
MKDSLKNIRPDSFSGMIFGLEGLRGGSVLLNGPTGCKFYHSATVDGNTLRALSFDPLAYPEDFYFGQGAVPCTFLDSHDYVYGAKDKLIQLLTEVKSRNHDFVVVINSPGAALIGDDLKGILDSHKPSKIAFAIDSPGFSEDYGKGLQRGLIHLLEELEIPTGRQKTDQVNLLGFHLFQKHSRGNLRELTRLLELGGVKVGTAFYECDIEGLKHCGESKLNIVLCPETGLELAKYCKKRFGTEYMVPKTGQPLGFEGEDFFRELSEWIPLDLSPILEEFHYGRGRAYIFLSRYSSILGKPKGGTYRIVGAPSFVYPALKFFTNYLGMIPLEVILEGEGSYFVKEIKDFLEPFEAYGPQKDGYLAQMVLGDGNEIASSVQYEEYLFGIEIAEPSMGYLDVMEKTFYGPKGALYLLEQVLNGLKFS